MRKVVDSNFLQSDLLAGYLSASHGNYAVLTDYAAMEAHKGDTLKSIFRSMEILARYPRQVIILKGTQALLGLTGRRAASQKSLIDGSQTRGFPDYCRALSAAKRGDLSLQNDLLAKGEEADAHMDRVLCDMSTLSSAFESVQKIYTAAELKSLRERDISSPKLLGKLTECIELLAGYFFEDHLSEATRPKGPKRRDAFLFRYALCTHALTINSSGGRVKTNPAKLRNDIVDVNFATFATYFDGLLTADVKAAETYAYAMFLLREVFAVPPWWLRATILRLT